MAASTSDLFPGKTEQINWVAFDQLAVSGPANEIAVLLYPFKSSPSSVTISVVSTSHYQVNTADGTDDLYYLTAPLRNEEVATDASFLFIRRQQGKPDRFSLVDGTYLRLRGGEVWKSNVRTSVEQILPK
jgi:hypothetical protein